MATWKVPVKIQAGSADNMAYNVWHIRTVDNESGPGSALSDALDALEEFYRDSRSAFSDATVITIGESMIRDPYGSPEYVEDDRRTLNGLIGGGTAPLLLAVVVGWRTTSATRSGRGRTFVGPLALGAMQSDGTPGPAAIGGIRDAATGLVNASTGANGWAVGVYSQKQNLLRDITGNSVKDRFSYLSSRRD